MDYFCSADLIGSRDGYVSNDISTAICACDGQLTVVRSDIMATTDALIKTQSELKATQKELQMVKDEMRSIKQMLYNTIALYKLKTRIY